MNSFENFSFEYGVSEQITPLVKRVIAKNTGPFNYTGTGTFITSILQGLLKFLLSNLI